MSSSQKRTEDLADRLVLDIKALVLLQHSDDELKGVLERKLTDSHDESIGRFVKALQTGTRPQSRGLILMAAGQLALASSLVLAGTLVLVPTFLGIDSPAGLIQYFVANTYGAIGGSPLGRYVSLIEFALGALLMLSAFYVLRQAAHNLKESGLTIKPGG